MTAQQAPAADRAAALAAVRTADSSGEYVLDEAALGQSAAFEVRRATRVKGGQECVVKVLNLAEVEVTPRGDPALELLSEINTLRRLRSAPGVVQLIDAFWQPHPAPRLFACLELLSGGDLFDRIEAQGPVSEPEAAQITRQIGGALAHMHAMAIVHRDIKPDNVVFAGGAALTVKLIDFGFAAVVPPGDKLRGLVGTMDYAAPEIISWYAGEAGEEGTPYDAAVDLWSFGVTLYIALCGFPPFIAEGDFDAVVPLIAAARFDFPHSLEGLPTSWGEVSAEAKQLLRELIAAPPAARLDAPGLLGSSWVRAHDASAATATGEPPGLAAEPTHAVAADADAEALTDEPPPLSPPRKSRERVAVSTAATATTAAPDPAAAAPAEAPPPPPPPPRTPSRGAAPRADAALAPPPAAAAERRSGPFKQGLPNPFAKLLCAARPRVGGDAVGRVARPLRPPLLPRLPPMPKLDMPKLDLPKVDLKLDLPKVDLKLDLPKVDLKLDLPKVDLPKLPKLPFTGDKHGKHDRGRRAQSPRRSSRSSRSSSDDDRHVTGRAAEAAAATTATTLAAEVEERSLLQAAAQRELSRHAPRGANDAQGTSPPPPLSPQGEDPFHIAM